jgi:anti-sigma regulatory factor (Ser/Thr protein kinase)
MNPSESSLEITLPATREAPSMARDALWKMPEAAPRLSTRGPDLELLVSELVTNSVRHAGLPTSGPISMRVAIEAGYLRIEVSDPGKGFTLPGPVESDGVAESGWGLKLVDRLADGWGMARTDAGVTTVWFEMHL